jgi:hypothetical protein
MLEDAPVGSPKWWLSRLDEERTRRSEIYAAYRELVDDVHPDPESAETSEKFRRMAGLSTTNLMGLAAEATAERMSVEGIRIGDEPEADKDAWRIWKDSDFDAGSDEAITAALIYERSFVSVAPPKDGKNPRLSFEDPSQVVLAYSPEGERIAALKVFGDEWTGDVFGTLYTPGYVVRMVRRGDDDGSHNPLDPYRWLARQMPRGAEAVTRNPLGEVPFFELQNRPLGEIRSELAPLVLPQRLLNQTMFNIQAIAEYGAFRQKWATGIEVPRNPETGQPIAPYEAHITKLMVAEGADAKFGDFNATDLKPHLDLAREIAGHMARISRLPATYFLTEVSNVGAETLALIVGGLVAKCKRRVKGYEPGLEGAMRLAFKARGEDGDAAKAASRIEVKWAEMETRSMAQAADAAVKLTQGDNPVITPQTAQEKWLGMSQTERDRDAAWRLENGAGVNLAALFTAPDPEA